LSWATKPLSRRTGHDAAWYVNFTPYHPLSLIRSDGIQNPKSPGMSFVPGEWIVAIGLRFGLQEPGETKRGFMAVHTIAVLGGDGIGPEVISQAVRVVQAAVAKHDRGHELKLSHLTWGSEFYKKHGQILPADGWDTLAKHDAILFGAIGSPDVSDTVTVHELLLPMRRRFDQYVNLRPAYLFEGVPCPLVGKKPGDIDMLVYRENTEGEYAPVGGKLYPSTEREVAIQTSVFTRGGCERILRAAFEAARLRPRKKLTSITKSNALVYGMTLWDEAYLAVRKNYPDVQSNSLLVDAAAMDFVRKPEVFDVVVASNLFGDILTDLSAAVAGSIGLASSANINPTKQFPSMFEPVHGSAPDIAGQGIANPLAAVLSSALMLDHLGLGTSANAVRKAVATVLKTGQGTTKDVGGHATTVQVGDAVVAAV
jgi:tartrate dehydrogenase/decarboxylase / D-malate dehydrogenase